MMMVVIIMSDSNSDSKLVVGVKFHSSFFRSRIFSSSFVPFYSSCESFQMSSFYSLIPFSLISILKFTNSYPYLYPIPKNIHK